MEGDVLAGRSRLSSSSSGSSHAQYEGGTSGSVGGALARRPVGAAVGRDGKEDSPVKIPKGEITPRMPEKKDVITSTPISSLPRPSFQVPDSSVMSTPGGVPLPPNPPPTPVGGVGGVPVPPLPPPTIPGVQQAHLKRVNWEKLHGTEGTIWKEVTASRCQSQGNPQNSKHLSSYSNFVRTLEKGCPLLIGKKWALFKCLSERCTCCSLVWVIS